MTKDKPQQMVVVCSECGNPIPSIPAWLSTAKVKFECEECRQKHAGKPIALDSALEDTPVMPPETELEEEEPLDEEEEAELEEGEIEEEGESAGEPLP